MNDIFAAALSDGKVQLHMIFPQVFTIISNKDISFSFRIFYLNYNCRHYYC